MKFCYINTENRYPHDKHLIDGLKQNNHDVFEICDKTPGFKKYTSVAYKFWSKKHPCDVIIVGFTSPFFVVLARCISFKKIIFNGVSSQYEANVVSREGSNPGFLKIMKWLLIDFLSFHLSSKILLESKAQIDYIHRKFFVPRRKLIQSYSGLDETEFYFKADIPKNTQFTVLFRGRFLPESGILTVLQAAKILENSNIHFLVIGHGFMYKEFNALIAKLQPKNLKHIHEKLDIETLRNLMLSCHISLGQLANHPRLDRTLPCKLFESIAMKLPYLTGRNKAALELLTDNENCMTVNPGDANDLAEKILFLKNNPDLLKKIGNAGYDLYTTKLTSKILAHDVLKKCLK